MRLLKSLKSVTFRKLKVGNYRRLKSGTFNGVLKVRLLRRLVSETFKVS